MQFAPERLGDEESRHRLADMGDKAMPLADQPGIVGFRAGAGQIKSG
jgi:hypothetical protein